MSDFTRQCVECASVVEWSGRGRPPLRCKRCNTDHEERTNAEQSEKKNGRRSVRRATTRSVASTAAPTAIGVDYGQVIASLQQEIERHEQRIVQLREALAVLEGLAEAAA
jgi:hypothetical protein